MNERPATDEADLQTALSALGDSMDGLSTDLSGLGDAVAKLQESTSSLSEQQSIVAAEMGATADSLTEHNEGPTARPERTSFGAAADD